MCEEREEQREEIQEQWRERTVLEFMEKGLSEIRKETLGKYLYSKVFRMFCCIIPLLLLFQKITNKDFGHFLIFL